MSQLRPHKDAARAPPLARGVTPHFLSPRPSRLAGKAPNTLRNPCGATGLTNRLVAPGGGAVNTSLIEEESHEVSNVC